VKAVVFDDRRNVLGEGPSATGLKNELIMWVDITGRKVRTRDMGTGEITEYRTTEDVSFAIPRKSGGEVIGTAHGPLLRDVDGTLHKLPTREDADGFKTTQQVRWNDAKVSPLGDLILGTMPYDFTPNGGALYQLRGDGKHMRRLFGDVTVSNGLGWTVNESKMFYVDTPLQRVDVFDVEGHEIRNRRTLVNFPEDMGSPDGISVDSNDNLWIAFWNGSAIRCFDGKSGDLLDEVICPAPLITSCVFGGENLDQLIITSASENTDLMEFPEAGMLFVASPGVRGQKSELFGA
jgi:sugar lactone lactonase YvrE